MEKNCYSLLYWCYSFISIGCIYWISYSNIII